MRVLIVFLVIVALAGAAFGSYAVFIQPTSASANASNEPGLRPVTETEMLAMRGDMEIMKEKYEARLEELEDLVGQQAVRIQELKKEVAAVRQGAPAASGPAAERTVNVEGIDREALKDLLSELNNERRGDERAQQFDRVREQQQEFRSRQLDRATEQLGWDEAKKQQVTDLLAQERAKIADLYEQMRKRNLSQEERQAITEQIRAANEQTQETLKAMMTEEEYNALQKALQPRRDRRPAGGNRGRGTGGGRR